MEVLLTIAVLALPISGLYFWGRGVVRSNKSDMVLGFSVLSLTFVLAVAVSRSSAILAEVGMVALVFGIETLIVSAFAGPDCPISRKERTAVGVGALIGGALFSLIV